MMLLLHFSSPVGHLNISHLIGNAFIINTIQGVFLQQRQLDLSFLGLLAHTTYFALGGSVSYSVRLLGGLHSRMCHSQSLALCILTRRKLRCSSGRFLLHFLTHNRFKFEEKFSVKCTQGI